MGSKELEGPKELEDPKAPVGVSTRIVPARSVGPGRMVSVVVFGPSYPAVSATVSRGPKYAVSEAGTRTKDCCSVPAVARREVGAGKPTTERVGTPPGALEELYPKDPVKVGAGVCVGVSTISVPTPSSGWTVKVVGVGPP